MCAFSKANILRAQWREKLARPWQTVLNITTTTTNSILLACSFCFRPQPENFIIYIKIEMCNCTSNRVVATWPLQRTFSTFAIATQTWTPYAMPTVTGHHSPFQSRPRPPASIGGLSVFNIRRFYMRFVLSIAVVPPEPPPIFTTTIHPLLAEHCIVVILCVGKHICI